MGVSDLTAGGVGFQPRRIEFVSTGENALSQPKEDYLGAIYRAQVKDGKASTGEVARRLGVSAASTTYMFKKLADEGLLDYKGYAGASLTEEGERAASGVIRRHRILERFLVDVLQFRWDEVDVIADKMEHTLPEEVIDRMEAFLSDPLTCPHGYPIPQKQGGSIEAAGRPLSGLGEGETAVVRYVAESDPELLRHLASCRLTPGSRVKMVHRSPVDELFTVQIDGEQITIGQRVARAVAVEQRGGDAAAESSGAAVE